MRNGNVPLRGLPLCLTLARSNAASPFVGAPKMTNFRFIAQTGQNVPCSELYTAIGTIVLPDEATIDLVWPIQRNYSSQPVTMSVILM
jgi:hypothetical protein